MSSTAQHAEMWEPLVSTDFSCTCHKVCDVGGQPEQIFDPNPPYGLNMAAQVQAIWSRNRCRCCRLASRRVFLAAHVESFIFVNGLCLTLTPRRRERKKNKEGGAGGGGGISCKTQTVWHYQSLSFVCGAVHQDLNEG